MLRLGEELQALVKAAEQPVVIDIEQAERMLDVLGVPRDEPLILARWWNDGDRLNMRHYPRKNAGEGYDWAALQVDRFYEAVAADFRPGTDSFGFVPERGGVAYGKRKEITEVRFLKYEIDDAGMSLEAQFETWRAAGLSPPTLVLFTGGKSLHFWWRLKTPLPLAEGIVALKRLQEAIRQATPGVKLDSKMESPAQPMRLAGGIHPKTRQRSTIYAADGAWYEAAQILELCPEIEVKAKAAKDNGGLFRAEEGEPAKPGQYPEPDELTQPVPLRLGLSRTTCDRIQNGDKEGVRATNAYKVAKALQEARAMIESLGYRVEEDPIKLFKVYCRNSDWCGYEGGFDTCKERHFAWPEEVGTGELSKSALRRAIAKWAEETGQWRWLPDWGRGKGFGKKADEPVQHPLGAWADEMSEWDWLISAERTPELVVFNALLKKAAFEGRPITSHQQRFLRYDDRLGFFEPVSTHRMQKLMLELLPYAFSQNAKGTKFRKHITAARAKSCTDLAALKLHEDQMDLEEAVAFRNGTYLLGTGELVPHSPGRKLTWAVDADFADTAECPPTMRRFIASSFGEEWESIIQVVLRYMVDPGFKCSRIVMILGASGSGKGTMERLIEKLFPSSVVSVITSGFADINHPDKIRQFVSGKRLLAFPDLQGRQVGVGTLYALTDGGKLTGRTLHESDAEDAEPFSGRVVICSTQPPSMDDAGNGMTRRMLVLPTSRPAGMKPDLDLDEKLKSELGQIVSWALRASRQEVKRLLAGGDVNGLLRDAATAAEIDMDAVRSFANACLVPRPSNHLPNETELFKSFQAFCTEQNHRPTSQKTFVSRLAMALPHLRADRRSVAGSNSTRKAPACFFGFGVKEGLIGTSMITHKPMIYTKHYVQNGYEELRCHKPDLPEAAEVLAILSPDSIQPCPDRVEEHPDRITTTANPME